MGISPEVASLCDPVTAWKLERTPKRSLGFTIGEPVSGELQMMQVKMMTPGFDPISIPLRSLEAVKPLRAKGSAIMISGEHFGKEAAVLGEAGHSGLWDVIVIDGEELELSVRVLASPDHLVVCNPTCMLIPVL